MRRGFFISALLLFAVAASRDQFDAWVGRTELPSLIVETSAEVLDRNGTLLRAYTVADGRWRLGAHAGQVDPDYLAMLIAYEDKRFYRHAGVDLLAMMRAVRQALWNGEIVSGGSTLSMQVARLLEDSGTGAWAGKLRQMRVAWALERELSKPEILELYLTLAPYGGNLEGVRAATLAYFGKEPRRLTTGQAALLVALPQSPEARRPDRDPEAARAARSRVLARVTESGVIDREAQDIGNAVAVPHTKRPFPAMAPHLSDAARRADVMRRTHRLTIDAPLQAALEQLAKEALRGQIGQLSVAMMIADHNSGEILASVGSASYGATTQRQGFVDMTRAIRSPGSTLKPLVYGMAFDQGLVHPETLIDDSPVAFGSYAPQNFDGEFRGELRLRDALKLSLNIPVVLLTQELGPARLMASMRRAGMAPKLPGGKAGLALALGGVGVTMHDMVTLYAGLARGGEAIELRHLAGGAPSKGGRIISRSAAWHVGHILWDITPPTGAGAQRLAFKTGTSYGHRDAWAVGFDGEHVGAVWIGRPDGTAVPGAFGGEMAAPILFEAFQRLKLEVTPLAPPPPETLMLSAASLPQPLRRFRSRTAVFEQAADAPIFDFPPDGALLALEGHPLTIKIREGVPPFVVLANGKPAVKGARTREISLPDMGQGYVKLSVIDARGRSAKTEVQLR